mmetsp:Transcript_15720/g.29659  ORF Transcript_15720/g.29659 Transcript_15720/m.29659 type:complete len:109 (+) Transcript_15720:435-761(+)
MKFFSLFFLVASLLASFASSSVTATMQEQDQVKEPVDGFDDKNLRGGVGEEGRKLGGYYYYSKSGKGKGKGSKGGKSGGYYVYHGGCGGHGRPCRRNRYHYGHWKGHW